MRTPGMDVTWLSEVETRLAVGRRQIVRRRTGEALDIRDPDATVHDTLTLWVYQDVHLRGCDDEAGGDLTRTEHPALTTLRSLTPSHYSSPGWTVKGATSGEPRVLTRGDLTIHAQMNDSRVNCSSSGTVTITLPRVRPDYAHGWNFVFARHGNAQAPLRRLYLADGDDVANIVTALDSAPALDKWQMKFTANHRSRRPDRCVLYVEDADLSAAVEAVSSVCAAAKNSVVGPGFSTRITSGVFAAPLIDDGTASAGLHIAQILGHAMLTHGPSWRQRATLPTYQPQGAS